MGGLIDGKNLGGLLYCWPQSRSRAVVCQPDQKIGHKVMSFGDFLNVVDAWMPLFRRRAETWQCVGQGRVEWKPSVSTNMRCMSQICLKKCVQKSVLVARRVFQVGKMDNNIDKDVQSDNFSQNNERHFSINWSKSLWLLLMVLVAVGVVVLVLVVV